MNSLSDALMRKSRRALRSARLALRDGDTDGAINRSYYAAQSALLSSGVPDDKLPRTHSGLISAFSERAVKSGKVEPEIGRAMAKTESLRLRTDYMGVELDSAAAEKALAGAERFVKSVEHAFGLQPISAEATPSEGHTASHKSEAQEKDEPLWDKSEGMEERRRRAVQDWLEYRKKQRDAARAASQERERNRARDQSESPGSGRDLSDDSDDG